MEKSFNKIGICELFGLNSVVKGLLFYPRYLAWTKTKDNDRILDGGSGFGSIFFASSGYKGLNLIALDLNPRMAKYANKVASVMNYFSDVNQRSVINGSSTNIPLDDGYIDTVIDSHSLVYVSERAKTLNEYRRVLKPGGSMILVPHTNRNLIEAVEDTFHSYAKKGNNLTWVGNPPLKIVKEY